MAIEPPNPHGLAKKALIYPDRRNICPNRAVRGRFNHGFEAAIRADFGGGGHSGCAFARAFGRLGPCGPRASAAGDGPRTRDDCTGVPGPGCRGNRRSGLAVRPVRRCKLRRSRLLLQRPLHRMSRFSARDGAAHDAAAVEFVARHRGRPAARKSTRRPAATTSQILRLKRFGIHGARPARVCA